MKDVSFAYLCCTERNVLQQTQPNRGTRVPTAGVTSSLCAGLLGFKLVMVSHFRMFVYIHTLASVTGYCLGTCEKVVQD